MEQKSHPRRTNFYSIPFVGMSLLCATPASLFSEVPAQVVIQAEDGRFIDQLGTYPLGENGTVGIISENGKINLSVTHSFSKKNESVSTDPKTGATVTKTATEKKSTTNSRNICDNPTAPWFVYLSKDSEIWAFNGSNIIYSSKTEVKGSIENVSSSTVSKCESFTRNPPKDTPKPVAERIIQILTTGSKIL